jgi:hypothetical protein
MELEIWEEGEAAGLKLFCTVSEISGDADPGKLWLGEPVSEICADGEFELLEDPETEFEFWGVADPGKLSLGEFVSVNFPETDSVNCEETDGEGLELAADVSVLSKVGVAELGAVRVWLAISVAVKKAVSNGLEEGQ